MTVAAQSTSQQVIAAAGQLVFPFAWRADSAAVVTVWVNDTQDGGFAVALNADQVAAPGGTITRAEACLGGEVVSVERVTPQSQNTALSRYGPFAAEVIVAAFDKAVMLVQELAAKFTRVVAHKRSSTPLLASTEMPAPVAGAVLAWVAVGAQYRLSSVPVVAQLPNFFSVLGEALVDSGDHVHFTSAFAPAAAALYRNGQRIFSPGDYSVAGNVWTLTAAVDPLLGEVLNADYTRV